MNGVIKNNALQINEYTHTSYNILQFCLMSGTDGARSPIFKKHLPYRLECNPGVLFFVPGFWVGFSSSFEL